MSFISDDVWNLADNIIRERTNQQRETVEAKYQDKRAQGLAVNASECRRLGYEQATQPRLTAFKPPQPDLALDNLIRAEERAKRRFLEMRFNNLQRTQQKSTKLEKPRTAVEQQRINEQQRSVLDRLFNSLARK